MTLSENKLREELQRLYREAAEVPGDRHSEITAARRMTTMLDEYVRALMDRCRAEGDSWDVIGTAYGTSGQNAGRWFRRHGGQDRHPSVLNESERSRRWYFGDDDQ